MPLTRQRWLIGQLDAALVGATSRWLQSLGDEFGFSHEDLYRIQLCFEELVSNLVDYSDARYTGQAVELRASVEDRHATFALIDPAAPFNPLSRALPAVASRIEDMPIGGQGIHLARQFSDAQRYERRNDRNCIELSFKLAQPTHLPDPHAPGFYAAVEIFNGVPLADVAPLIEHMPIQQIVGAQRLLERGDMNDALRVVLQGRLRVYLDQPEGDDFMAVLPGACVGEMSLIDVRPVSAYVVSEPGTRLLLIDAATFLDRLLAIPQVSRNLISILNDRTRRNDQRAIEHMRKLLLLEQAQRELQYAHAIQASLLPKEPLFASDTRLDCVGRMCPAREVGGDFYDIFLLDSRHLFFVIADVCGKGLPAALFMVRAIAALRVQSANEAQSPDYTAHLIARLNHELIAHNDAQQFLTAFCGILDLDSLRLRYVNAGHNPPLLALGHGRFRYLEEPISPIVGMVEGLNYRAGEVTLERGSALLLYTDGVTEAENTAMDMLGEERLLQQLNAAADRTAGPLVDEVFNLVRKFAGEAPQSDDITVLAIRCAA